MNKYNDDVMEVHNEFMTAGDTMLKQAEEILSKKVEINPAKIARLTQFGFKSSKDATAVEDDKKEKSHQQKMVEAICDFRIQFPNHKFIPTDKVKSICEKYGLVSGEAHQYKGFVPDKNLSEIEHFFEVYPDMKHTYWRKPSTGDGIISWVSGDVQISKSEYAEITAKNERKEEVAEIKEATKKAVQSFKKGMDMEIPARTQTFNWYESDRPSSMFRSGFDPYMNEYGSIGIRSRRVSMTSLAEAYAQMYLQYPSYDLYTGGVGTKNYSESASKKDVKLRICAPISEMNTSGYELQDGYKLVYDPIVSIEVIHKNGIKGEIILTAWGDEASDELVIDQNKN